MVRSWFVALMTLGLISSAASLFAADYVVVVSTKTAADADWQPVVAALVAKHQAEVLTYQKSPAEALAELQKQHPRFTCFVAPSAEAGKDFVAAVHQLTRKYDDDPYADTFWGILTGYDAGNALAIAKHTEPLEVKKVAGGTEVALEMCREGLWYDELVKNKFVKKTEGKSAVQEKGPSDTTAALVDSLNVYQPDLFVTSGHATERDWMIGFTYKNGFFKSKAGQLFGEDTAGGKHQVDAPQPKVYLPIGNCLMGHIDGPDAMALAWMNDAGVKQMIGYTVPTWYGYSGWGLLDYFVEQPGRYTFNEAFLANQHALIHSLQTGAGNKRGLEYDRDVVAFYGDPAWQARMADAPKAYDQELKINGNEYTFTITPHRGAASFQPINKNGAERGWRPIVQFLPARVKNGVLKSGAELKPVVTDDFVLLPNPRECDPAKEYRIIFHADAAP